MLTQKEFIKRYAREYNVAEYDTKAWVTTLFEFLGEMILENDVVRLPTIGAFKQVCWPGRRYLDCNSGEYKISEPRMKVEYAPTQKFADQIRALPPNLSLLKNFNGPYMDRILPCRQLHDDQDNSEDEETEIVPEDDE